jgi:hypothetical protein
MAGDVAERMAQRFDHHHPAVASNGVPQQVYRPIGEYLASGKRPADYTIGDSGLEVHPEFRDCIRVRLRANPFRIVSASHV